MQNPTDSMTILLLACYELSYVQLSVDSIRNFGGISELSVILVEKDPVAGLREWAAEQQDLSYVYMDEEDVPWGSCLNQVLEAFQVEGNILIMQSGILLTKGTLLYMQETLDSDDKAGMVGCVLNQSYSQHQLPDQAVPDYSVALQYSQEHEQDRKRKVMGLDAGIILTSGTVLEDVGGFEDQIFTTQILVKDLALRLIEKGYRSYVCRRAFAFTVVSRSHETHLMNAYSRDLKTMEKRQGMHYFNMQGNMQLLTLLDRRREEAFSALEIGCDCGATLNDIKVFFPSSYTCGCDINVRAVEIAAHFADQAVVANVEEEALRFPEKSFDYVIFGDVLEHLHQPQKTLEYMAGLLKDDGCILANIPNVMHISVMRQLLHGDFTYTEIGLLDRTHIHLFTYNEIIRMFEQAGYAIEVLEPSYSCDQDDPLIDKLLELDQDAKRFMYEAFQYKVRARLVERKRT